MVISFNLPKSFFIHCLLIVQDLYDGVHTNDSVSSINTWLQNFEIYIGDDTDYIKNTKCPGGPFMDSNDSNSYTPG